MPSVFQEELTPEQKEELRQYLVSKNTQVEPQQQLSTPEQLQAPQVPQSSVMPSVAPEAPAQQQNQFKLNPNLNESDNIREWFKYTKDEEAKREQAKDKAKGSWFTDILGAGLAGAGAGISKGNVGQAVNKLYEDRENLLS